MFRPLELSSDMYYNLKLDYEGLTLLNNLSVKLVEYEKRPGFIKALKITEEEMDILDQVTQIHREVYKQLYESAD